MKGRKARLNAVGHQRTGLRQSTTLVPAHRSRLAIVGTAKACPTAAVAKVCPPKASLSTRSALCMEMGIYVATMQQSDSWLVGGLKQQLLQRCMARAHETGRRSVLS